MPPDHAPGGSSDILVSALVSTWSAERFIEGLLEDLEGQSIRDRMEIVIVDAHSPEREGEIVRRWQERFDNIVYVRTDARENAHCSVNRAFRQSRGRYVTPAATDDRHHPRCFERLVAALEAAPEALLAYADSAVTCTENQSFAEADVIGWFLWPEYDRRTLFDCCIIGPQPLYRRELHEWHGGFDEEMLVAGDYEMWLRAAAAGHQFVHVPELLGLYLQNMKGNEYSNQKLCFEESERARQRHWRDAWGLRPEPRSSFFVSAGAPRRGRVRAPVGAPPPAPATVPPGASRAAAPTHATVVHPGPATGATPQVSVVIPTRDRPVWLERAVRSALAQRDIEVEIIVVNDGGAPVEDRLVACDAGGRIISLRLPASRERSAARNAGLALARGTWVAFLDDDDWWQDDHLAALVEHAVRTGGRVVYSDARAVLERPGAGPGGYAATGEQVMALRDFDRAQLLVGNYIPILCALVHRDVLSELGGFDPGFSTHEDWELWLRLSSRYTFHHLPRVSAHISWRDDGSSTTSSRQEDFLRTCEEIHTRYADEAERLPGVREAQLRYLEAMRARLAKPASGIAQAATAPADDDELARARLALASNQLAEARACLDRALGGSSDNAEVWLTEGVLSIQELDYSRAADAFERAATLGGDARRAQLGFGMAALGANRAEEAWETLAALDAGAPGDPAVVHWLLRAGVVLERWDALAEHLVEHLRVRGDDHATRFALAGIQLRRGALPAAEALYLELIETAPEFDGLDALAHALADATA